MAHDFFIMFFHKLLHIILYTLIIIRSLNLFTFLLYTSCIYCILYDGILRVIINYNNVIQLRKFSQNVIYIYYIFTLII